MGKGEIARYEQFLLFPQCLQKLSVVDAQNEHLWNKELSPLFPEYGISIYKADLGALTWCLLSTRSKTMNILHSLTYDKEM